MDTHFHFQIHAALSCFSSHLCLLLPLSSFSLLFWSLSSSLFTPWHPQMQSQKADPTLPAHTSIPPKNGRKKTQETTFKLLLFGDNIIKPLYVGSTCIHFIKDTCTNPASSDLSSLLFAFLIQNKIHSASLLYSVWKPP